MGFDAKDYVRTKVNQMSDPRLLHNLKKATERKHHYGYMTTEIYKFTVKLIDERMEELQE